MLGFVAAFPEALKSLGIGEALSGIFGSISLTAWICLLVCREGRMRLSDQWLTLPCSFPSSSRTTRRRVQRPYQ
jgi:hypothetical protein